MAAKRKSVDRERLELDYRAGIKTFREMAADHEISAPRVKQIANEEGWSRDLTKRIQAAAEDKLNKANLNAALNADKKKVSENEVVDVISTQQVAIRLAHRQDIQRSRALFAALMDELEATTNNRELFEQLGELLDRSADEGRTDKLNELYRRVTTLTGRVENAKKLVEVLEKVVRLEREAFGIDKEDGKENPIDTALKAIAEMKRNGIRPGD